MFTGLGIFFRLKYNFKFLNKKQLKKYQFKQIKKLIRYSKQKSSFYQHYYNNYPLNDLKDFYNLPTINKEIMMENLSSLNTLGYDKEELLEFALYNEENKIYEGYFKDEVVVGLSSGTSGNKGIYITPKDLTKQLPFAFLARSGISLKLLPFKIAFFLRVFSQGFEDINSSFINLKYMSTMIDINEAIDFINDLEINILMAPPSFIRQLIPYVKEVKTKIEIIVTYAEVLTKEDKLLFKDKFNADVIEIYQASEGQIANACKHGNLHINEDLVFVELYDEDNNLIEEQNKIAHKMIVTNLINYAQPLIRYEMNDLIRLGDSCSCGSSFRVIESIIGRDDDVLYFYDKNNDIKYVFPDLFSRWIITIDDNIRELKVINYEIGKLKLIIELINEESEALEEKIFKKLDQELSEFGLFDYALTISYSKIDYPKNKYKRFERTFKLD